MNLRTYLNSIDEDINSAAITEQLEGVIEAIQDVVYQLHGFRDDVKPIGQPVLDDLDKEGDQPRSYHHVTTRRMCRDERDEGE